MILWNQKAHSQRSNQQGIVMIVALIAIVAMTFAVYAMLRTTGSSLGVAGNLAFKQNATAAADRGVEHARAWLMSQSSLELSANQAAHGYFAAGLGNFDPLTYASWTAATAVDLGDDGAGNQTMYVVHRLCRIAGSFNLSGQECVRPSSLNTSGGTSVGLGGGAASGSAVPVTPVPYFRVTVRVAGPRSTLSYVQVIMY
jgi:type IV pilus assembly protein PilX